MHEPAAPENLQLELDRCVKCGMCLPECPTYRLNSDENESPRGRLALIEGLVTGRLQGDEALVRHLDSCLGCRRCERLCPSQVRYGRLIDQGRGVVRQGSRRRLARWFSNPGLLKTGTRLAHLIPAALSRPLGPIHRLHSLGRALPPSGTAPRPGDYAALGGPRRGRVVLFTGCTGSALQGDMLNAALALLRHAGYDVRVPERVHCCGALSQHAGDLDRAARLADDVRAALTDGVDALVSVASGCGIHLDGYEPPLPVQHMDISRFLLEQGGFTGEDFAPLPARLALHTPCSVENVYRGAAWARGLLGLIPEIEVVPVGETGQCCGAAGDHMLRRPQQAALLRDPLVQQLADGGFTLLATSNIGCAMHLASGLSEAGLQIEIVHPVEILARQSPT
jgi:glycolate oxidase iron-sulfur subunit